MTTLAEFSITFDDPQVATSPDSVESKPFDSENGELVELVALYRKHIEAQQVDHSHTKNVAGSQGGSNGKSVPKKMGKFKQSLTSSFENLFKKQKRVQSQESSLTEKQHSKLQKTNASPLTRSSTITYGSHEKPSSVEKSSSVEKCEGLSVNGKDRALSLPIPKPVELVAPDQPTGLPGIKSVGHPSNVTEEPKLLEQVSVTTVSLTSSSRSITNSVSEPSSPAIPAPEYIRKHRRNLSLTTPTTSKTHISNSHTMSRISELRLSQERGSPWRQNIYDDISTTPQRGRSGPTSTSSYEILNNFECSDPVGMPLKRVGAGDTPRTRAKKRWRVVIEQQIMLNRMEKLNKSLQTDTEKAEQQRKKLSYYDPTINVLSCQKRWEEILLEPSVSDEELQLALLRGVPPLKRGEVWRFLISRYTEKVTPSSEDLEDEDNGELDEEYDTLQDQDSDTDYNQVISMDLGRTFPSHPYFAEAVEEAAGQKELFNILHAYSKCDKQVGYCQGMSYIGGIFLIHSKEEEQAFDFLHYYMKHYKFRDHYKHNMFALQVRLYQLSAQIHDCLPRLHAHLEKHSMSTYLIAAPWFLTMFSSQYPMAFVARVMDLIFYQGMEAFFKVALALLTLHEDLILQCDGMESISEYFKTAIPESSLDHLPYIVTKVLKAPPEFGLKLKALEGEYSALHDMKLASFSSVKPANLEEELQIVKKQNSQLIEQVAVCRGTLCRVEAQLKAQEERETRKDAIIEMLTRRIEDIERKMSEIQN